MPSSRHSIDSGSVAQPFVTSASAFTPLNSFDPKLGLTHSNNDSLNFFSFDDAAANNRESNNDMHGYDFSAISPTMSQQDMLYRNDQNSRPSHVNPAAMWENSNTFSPSTDAKLNGHDQAFKLGGIPSKSDRAAARNVSHITPPNDQDDSAVERKGTKRADSGTGETERGEYTAYVSPRSSSHSHPSPPKNRQNDYSPKRARKASSVSDGMDIIDDSVDKREKYREKNRVAAAKCRAKKKDNVDHLEENHRTQSVLNTALKQTEKSLRDELSFWRTQALQHTFCSCRSIQEYNMRKAKNLAAESTLGNSQMRSPSTSSSNSNHSPVPAQHGIHGFGKKPASANASSGSVANDSDLKSIDNVLDFVAFSSVGRSRAGPSDTSMSRTAEQKLKNFVNASAS